LALRAPSRLCNYIARASANRMRSRTRGNPVECSARASRRIVAPDHAAPFASTVGSNVPSPPMTPDATLPPYEEVADVRVLYVDTDQMGVVNNVHYLRWFEIGRAEWIRRRGKPYKELEALGIMLPVVEAHVRYRRPARYDDLVAIFAGPRVYSQATVTFGYELRKKDDRTLLAEGWTRHAAMDARGRVQRFPVEVLSMLGFSDGRTQT
jgi:acyl-CoA thioester hydrolase